jgi:hypothetical protein
LPSVSINSFTASQAFSKGMKSPTGSGVPCKLRTCSFSRARSLRESYNWLSISVQKWLRRRAGP